MQPLLNMKQVCELLNVSHDVIEKEMKAGRLAGTKIGRQWRFEPDVIEEYVKSRTIKLRKVPAQVA